MGVQMHQLVPQTHPESKLIRLQEVLRLVPVSKSTWWAGVKAGIYPQLIKLGPKITCWRLSDIVNLISGGVGRWKPKQEILNSV